ncbi:MAG: hypothetical protein KatS3mg077_2181 [Candidatus Binatia bacterium]|nr:MAG: hypothetical protein KatS3mg077_2181 [Candidatus Binatia bacterium]
MNEVRASASPAHRLDAPLPAPTRWRGYELSWQWWSAGTVRVQVATVADLARHVDTEALLRDPNAPEPPYWAYLWPGSRALARYLVSHAAPAGGRALEVGCGAGLVSVVLACLGAQVWAFDRDRDAVALCRLNAAWNGVSVGVWRGDLGQPSLRSRVDLLCAADVTYDPRLQQAVLALAATRLSETGRLLCTESVRTFDREWLADAARRGFSIREEQLDEADGERSVPVRMIEMRWAEGKYE